ncbi:uncharacterized protein isoform X1 [Bombus fervidus]|uniref:uncharacterized protein isoform X1 n=2 Tax=Bombus fervidus TaxID=203811 RepID=UPI003D188123
MKQYSFIYSLDVHETRFRFLIIYFWRNYRLLTSLQWSEENGVSNGLDRQKWHDRSFWRFVEDKSSGFHRHPLRHRHGLCNSKKKKKKKNKNKKMKMKRTKNVEGWNRRLVAKKILQIFVRWSDKFHQSLKIHYVFK